MTAEQAVRLSGPEAIGVMDGALEGLARTYSRWFRMAWDHSPLAVDLVNQLDAMGYTLTRQT